MALQSKESYRVVESASIGFMQHNPYNWRVEGTHFKELEDVKKGNKVWSEAFNEWLLGLEDEQIKAFVESWYQIVSDANITTLWEFSKEPGKTLLNLIDAFLETDDNTKEMAKKFVFSLRDIATDNLKCSMENIKNQIQEKLERE